MKNSPDLELINDLSIELGVLPVFIEKDWYAMKVLEVISRFFNPTMHIIFAGGTSLSKAYNLIQRFSEDLDFRILFNSPVLGKKDFKKFREDLLSDIAKIEGLKIKSDSILSRNQSRFFSVLIAYNQSFVNSMGLRSDIKLEVSFIEPILDIQERNISSLLDRYKITETKLKLKCLNPIETAADKFSALLWRILNRDNTIDYDPSLIRHLYDLCALEKIVKENQKSFVEILVEIYKQDSKRGLIKEQLLNACRKVSILFEKDERYHIEYKEFVSTMSYATSENEITYINTIQSYYNYVDLIRLYLD